MKLLLIGIPLLFALQTFAFGLLDCEKAVQADSFKINDESTFSFSRKSSIDDAELINHFVFSEIQAKSNVDEPNTFLQIFKSEKRKIMTKIYYVNGRPSMRNGNSILLFDVCVDPSGTGKFEFFDEAATQLIIKKSANHSIEEVAIVNTFTHVGQTGGYVVERIVMNKNRMIQSRDFLSATDLVDDGRVEWKKWESAK